MDYKTKKTYTCKTFGDTLEITCYLKDIYKNSNDNGAYVLFNGKKEYWNDGKVFNFIQNWC